MLPLVEELNVVGGGDGNTIPTSIDLIERFTNTARIILVDPAVVHKLDTAILDHGSALGSIVHHDHLRVGHFVHDSDGSLNG